MATEIAKELELKKHVGSIHCSNTLSLLQRKISNVLLYHAYDELLTKEEHEIAIKTLCKLIGYSSHDYDTLKKALKALISTVLEWNLLGDGKGNGAVDDWNASSILSSVGIKGGICTYSYSRRLKKLLYMPEIYGRINIAIQARFKSNYALALYENCVRYQNLPHTRWFSITTFRKLMGVPEEKYIIFRDFKRRVLDKSVEEVNSFSDIHVVPEIEREGQKVHRIRFKLNPHSDANVNEESKKLESISQELTAFGLSKEQAQKLLHEYNGELIAEKIKLIKTSHAYLHDKVNNVAAYLKSALKENYQHQKKRLPSQIKVERNSNQEDEVEQKNYAEYVSKIIDDIFEQLTAKEQENIIQAFEHHLQAHNNTFVLEKYYAKGFSNRIVKSMFRSYIRAHFSSILPVIETFENYKSQH